MRTRLLRAMLFVAVVAVAGFGVPLALSVQARYRGEALVALSEEAAGAVVAVPSSFARNKDRPELPSSADGISIALYGSNGRKIRGQGPRRGGEAVGAAIRHGAPQRRPGDLVVAYPISDKEKVVGAIRTSLASSTVTARTRRTWAAMAVLAGGVLVVAGLLAARRSRSLAQPLAQLRDDADVIGAGGEVTIRPATGVVEIDAVHTALADAGSRLNAVVARERSFSADLAHQLRTPLASLSLHLESARKHGGPDAPQLDDAMRDVDRLGETIDDLLTLARDTEPSREPHPLGSSLREAASRWEPKLTAAGRRLDLDFEAHLPWVEASPAAIRQILDVLIDNALTHGAGAVRLSGSRVGQGAVLAVADHGDVVVDAETIFVRRSDEAVGTGIGLALASRLAAAEDMRLVLAYPGPGVVVHLVVSRPSGRPRDAASGAERNR